MIPYSNVCQTFLHGETRNIIFCMPRNPYVRKCSQGKNCLWRGNAIHLLINHCPEKLLETASIHKSASTVIKIWSIFCLSRDIWTFSRYFKIPKFFYLFVYISRFLAEHRTMLRGILVGKHRRISNTSTIMHTYIRQYNYYIPVFP